MYTILDRIDLHHNFSSVTINGSEIHRFPKVRNLRISWASGFYHVPCHHIIFCLLVDACRRKKRAVDGFDIQKSK